MEIKRLEIRDWRLIEPERLKEGLGDMDYGV